MGDSGTVIRRQRDVKWEDIPCWIGIDIVVLYDSFHGRHTARGESRLPSSRSDEEEESWRVFSSRNWRQTLATTQVETNSLSCLIEVYQSSLVGQQS